MFFQLAGAMWDEFNAWYDAHPAATFDEMEQQLSRWRRPLMGQTLTLTLRRGDLGAMPEPPACEQCGKPMEFKGYPDKTVHGIEADAEIPRAYYVCPTCEAGLFPPGPTPGAAAR
jgi:hypothetical protein